MTLQRSNGNDENDGNDDGDDDSSEIIDSGVARWKPHLFFCKGFVPRVKSKYIIDGHEGAKPRRYSEWLFYCCCCCGCSNRSFSHDEKDVDSNEIHRQWCGTVERVLAAG